MATYGYLTYLLRAGRSRRPESLYPLTRAGHTELDLLDVFEDQLRGLGPSYHPVTKKAEGFRIRRVERRGRTLWVRINRGPAGSPGETYDLDTEQSVDTTDRQAQLNELRALFVVPERTFFGLLFVERIGVRNLKDTLNDIVIRPAATTAGSVLRVESFAEVDDWERELRTLPVLRVSEMLEKRSIEEDDSTVSDTLLTIGAQGSGLQRVGDRLKRLFTDRVERRDDRMEAMRELSELVERRLAVSPDSAVAFIDDTEYQDALSVVQGLNEAEHDADDSELVEAVDEVIPIDREQYEHRRFEVTLGERRPQRNIVVESASIPQFVYELGGRLTDSALRQAWVDHAVRFYAMRHVDLPVGWSDRTTRESR